MRYYFSPLPDKCDETVQDDVGKCWNLARNFKESWNGHKKQAKTN